MPYIDWMGKEDVIDHHKSIVYKTIECKEEIGDKDSENMIIKGDNLLALKSLLPYYASSVKMIYIDPPYNTGNTSWVYNDNMDSPLIKKWLNDTVNAEDLSRSDKWLCMMYPRLKLLRELLKDDGVIFISIDDAEVFNLKLICDEIFGKENFISNLIWQHSIQPKGYTDKVSIHHNYTLIYSKSSNFKLLEQERTDEDNKSYSNPDNDSRGIWRTGDVRNALYRPNLIYNITTPSGKVINPPVNGWRWSKKTLNIKIDTGEIFFNKDETKIVRKIYLDNVSGRAVESILFGKEVGTTRDGSNQLKDIFGKKIFDTPKPIQLIQTFLKYSTSKNDIILDSFAGSGTTAHAVLEQNKEDGGNRKFILIETLDYAKDITAERVKRVIEGYEFTGKDKTTLYEKKLTTAQILKTETMEKISKEVAKIVEDEKPNYTKIEKTFKENILKVVGIKDIKTFKDGIGGGFKYCELSYDIFDEFGELNSKLSFEQIAKHLYFVEFKKPIDKNSINQPFVGTHKNSYIYFYKDKFLNRDLKELLKIQKEYKELIIYTAKSTISDDVLKENNIIVRYIPYDIKEN